MALAYFITFTTYGTWLHGTSKGFGSVDDEHHTYGTPFVAPDAIRMAAERRAMVEPPYVLDAPRRTVVCDAIVALAHNKGWYLWAVHVRSNHVHVVISAERDPERLMSDLKARASGDLTRAGFEYADRRRWTRHGSTKHLFAEDVLAEKIHYTLDEQGERMAWYDGRKRGTA
jgi:REP element-mobilizing transposase RayT